MRVYFIYPDIRTRGSTKHIQNGLASISAVLKEHGHQTALYYLTKERDRDLEKQLQIFKPDIIAFTAATVQFKYVRYLAAKLKKEFSAFYICGGPHVTLEPESIEETNLDAICRGEGEYPLLELVNCMQERRPYHHIKNLWFKKDEKIITNPLREVISNLDELPFPDREIFDYQKIIDSNFCKASFLFNRGCPFDCSYCCNHALKDIYPGRYVRTRSVEKAIEEIELVIRDYNVKEIEFDDDIMTLNKRWFSHFLDEYKKYIGLTFDLNTRVGVCDFQLFKRLKDAGCRRVSMGIESGDEDIRQRLLKRKMTNDDIKKAFQEAHNAGLRTKSFNIIGFPEEDISKFMNTVRLNQEIRPSSLILNVFYPYPGTELYKICKENNYLGREPKNFIERDDTILKLPTFKRKDILRLYRRFGYMVYCHHSLRKAISYSIRYSRIGEWIMIFIEKTLSLGGKNIKMFIKRFAGV